MQRILFVILAPLSLAALHAAPAAIPIAFEQNVGQTDRQVRYFARAQGAILWLTDSGAVLGINSRALRMRLPGARKHPTIEGLRPLAGRANYFIGNDPLKWRTGVAQFGRVRYRDVFPGIDLEYYGQSGSLEFDWILAPRADPRAIRMAFDGAHAVKIDSAGDLVLQVGSAQIREMRPRVFQEGRPVDGRFIRRGRDIGFEVASYDVSKPLTIDPVLTYASYLGGNQGDNAFSVAVDSQGMLVVAGFTNSANFPTKRAIIPTFPNVAGTAFIAKINPAASGSDSLVWSTFLGGGFFDVAYSVALDKSDAVYVTGAAQSSNFPTVNAFQSNLASTGICFFGNRSGNGICPDAFVAKLTPSGNQLLYSSFLGGAGRDYGYSIVVDKSSNAWVSGFTKSPNFPQSGLQLQNGLSGSGNGFVAEVSPDGQTLIYSSYFGGEGTDSINASAMDSAGNLYVAGSTTSATFPVMNAFQPSLAAITDGFVAKFNTAIRGQLPLLYSTYLGGAGGDSTLAGVAVDAPGNIYVTGGTNSLNYPVTTNAFQQRFAGVSTAADPNVAGVAADAVATKLNPNASGRAQLLYSTYLAGSLYDYGWNIAVDKNGLMIVAGVTDSPDFPVTQNGFLQSFSGVQYAPKAFLSMIDPSIPGPTGLLYSTYYGGSGDDEAYALALDPTGVTIAGITHSTDLPVTSGALQSAFGGQMNGTNNDGDALIARFDLSRNAPVIAGATNAASFESLGVIAPGEIITLFGSSLGPTTLQTAQLDFNGRIATTVAGCYVAIDGTPAPIVYISAAQTSVVAPYELSANVGQKVLAQMVCNGLNGNVFPFQVVSAAPGVFSAGNGTGQGAVLNSDGSYNSPSNPAAKGSLIQIFATGEGALSPTGLDGRIETGPLTSIPRPVSNVAVTIGGVTSQLITYSGVAPDSVDGLWQVDAQVPLDAPSGNVELVLIVGGVRSQPGLTIAVR